MVLRGQSLYDASLEVFSGPQREWHASTSLLSALCFFDFCSSPRNSNRADCHFLPSHLRSAYRSGLFIYQLSTFSITNPYG
eukprot:6200888-Pleurochrysis_carterae.AAC.2